MRASLLCGGKLSRNGARWRRAGRCSEAKRALLFDAGARMMAAGAKAIVLAGTDLNLAFDGVDAGYPVIDALHVPVGVLAGMAAFQTR